MGLKLLPYHARVHVVLLGYALLSIKWSQGFEPCYDFSTLYKSEISLEFSNVEYLYFLYLAKF